MLEAEETDESLCVAIEIETVFENPVSRKTLKEHAVLSSISILRQTRGTNFPLTEIQADSLDTLCPLAATKPLSLSEAFSLFRKNNVEQLRVKIRHLRAKQLREILSDVNNITLDVFNRELWLLESSTLLNGVESKGRLFAPGNLDDEVFVRVSTAIDEGTIELHGNYVWRPASSVFGSRLNNETDDQKLVHVQTALRILTDNTLSAVAKVKQIESVPGFGFTTASGMAMIFHPNDLMIFDKQSIGAFGKLNLGAKTFEQFQPNAMELKATIGVDDFIEMDWFLYLINQGQIEIADREQRERMLSDIADVVQSNVISSNAVQTEKEQLVKSRIGQGVFRQNIQQLEKACRVSGVDDSRFLIASHIKPWAACNNEERLDGANGLFLCPNIDWLFDRGYISFRDDGTLMIASVVESETLQRLGVTSDTENCGAFSPQQKQFLEYHRRNIFIRSDI